MIKDHLGEVEYKDAPHTKGYCLKKKVKHFSEAHAWLSLKKFLVGKTHSESR